jgi:hypothetical protein
VIEQPVRSREGGTWTNVGPYERHPVASLLAMPAGTSRNFDLGGLLLPFVAMGDGTFRVLPRRGVPAHVLAPHRSARREKQEPR